MSLRLFPLIVPLLLAGCVAPAPPPRPAEVPPVVVTPPPAVVPPTATDWRDAPETPGGWRYLVAGADPVARFGNGEAAQFELRCERASRTVYLSRLGGTGGTMTIRTSYGERSWPAASLDGRTAISLAARDPFLDQLAFSRGRFSVALDGLPLLLMPAWAEPARVIEECRR